MNPRAERSVSKHHDKTHTFFPPTIVSSYPQHDWLIVCRRRIVA
jgi:hypothetical protein